MTADVQMTPEMQALLDRLAAAEARLAEAEETLAAIRNGEVDGLVVAGPHGDQVFTLKGSDHPYRVMIEAMEEGAATLGADGTILFCNRRFASMLRLPHAQVLGTNMVQFLVLEHQAHFAELVLACRLDCNRNEVVLQAGDGTRVPVSLACSALPEGETESLCIVATDVTAQKAAEATIRRQNEDLEARVEARTAELRESEARFRSVLDNSQDVIYRLNVQTQRFEYISPSAESVVGYSPADLMAMDSATALAMIHPDDLMAMRAALAGLEEIGIASAEYRQRSKNGEYRWLSNRMSLTRDSAGQLLHRNGNIRDITEQKQAEEALRESEALLRAFQEQLPVGIALINLQGEEHVSNSIYRRFVPHQIPSRDPDRMQRWQTWTSDGQPVPPADWPGARGLHGEDVPGMEFLYTGPDGQEIWTRVSAVPFRDASDEIVGVVSVIQDIDSLKRTEEALRESEARERERAEELAVLLGSVPVGVYISHDPNCLHMTGNYAADEILRIPHGNELSLSAPEHTRPVHFRTLKDGRKLRLDELPAQRSARGERITDFEFTLAFDDGMLRHVLGYGTPLLDAQGSPRGSVAVLVDITERKRIEEALKLTQTSIDGAAEMVAWFRPDGSVHYINDATCRTLGYSREELLKLNALNFSPGFTKEQYEEHWQEVRQRKSFILQPVHCRKDGSTYIAEVLVNHVVYGGQEFIFAYGRDITDRIQAEEALQASLREKEVLLKEIHHRVKNNMQVISSLVSLQSDALDDPALRPLFNDLRDRVRTMALVHEKLYQSESLARVDFAEYTQSLLNYLWRAHGDATAAVRLTLEVQPVSISIEQAVPCGLMLNELVTNALKHAFRDRAGGELTVALRADPDGQVCLSVRDNGIGLPADWRQSPSLGLQLVQMLASQVRGTLDVHSDDGTAFTLTFSQPTSSQHGEDRHA